MAEQLLPLEKKVVTVVNSVTSNKEELPALVRSVARSISYISALNPVAL